MEPIPVMKESLSLPAGIVGNDAPPLCPPKDSVSFSYISNYAPLLLSGAGIPLLSCRHAYRTFTFSATVRVRAT